MVKFSFVPYDKQLCLVFCRPSLEMASDCSPVIFYALLFSYATPFSIMLQRGPISKHNCVFLVVGLHCHPFNCPLGLRVPVCYLKHIAVLAWEGRRPCSQQPQWPSQQHSDSSSKFRTRIFAIPASPGTLISSNFLSSSHVYSFRQVRSHLS